MRTALALLVLAACQPVYVVAPSDGGDESIEELCRPDPPPRTCTVDEDCGKGYLCDHLAKSPDTMCKPPCVRFWDGACTIPHHGEWGFRTKGPTVYDCQSAVDGHSFKVKVETFRTHPVVRPEPPTDEPMIRRPWFVDDDPCVTWANTPANEWPFAF